MVFQALYSFSRDPFIGPFFRDDGFPGGVRDHARKGELDPIRDGAVLGIGKLSDRVIEGFREPKPQVGAVISESVLEFPDRVVEVGLVSALRHRVGR
jgi:hypothetical protein